MSQLGKAYIEVTADLSKFPAELRAKLKAALAAGLEGVDFKALDDKAVHAGESAARQVRKGFSSEARHELVKAGEEGGRSLLSGMGRLFSRNSSGGGGFLSTVTGFFKDVFSQASNAASSAASNLGGQLSGVFSKLGDIGGGDIGSVLKIAAFTVLIPVAIELAGALFQLGAALFALPAAASVAAAALVPLIIGFQGFGEAVGAGLSGDTKKFNEALKGLPPSMRAVVKEFVGLKGLFSGVKSTIQENLFQPLVGVLGPAIRAFLQATRGGLGLVANSLGNLISQLVILLTYGDSLKTWQAVLATTARIIDSFGNGLGGLLEGVLATIQVALPYVEKFFGAISQGLMVLGKWLGQISKDGRLNAWLARAADIGQKLWEALKQIGIFVGTILNSLGDEGTDTIRGLAEAFQHLNQFLTTSRGQEFLHNLGVLFHWLGDTLVFMVRTLDGTFVAVNLTFDAVRKLLWVFQQIGGAAVVAGKAIASFFVWIWNGIKTAGVAIGDFFTKDIPRWFHEAVAWFENLPHMILNAMESSSSATKNWFEDLLKGWYASVLFHIGQIIGVFLGTPQILAQAWSALGSALSSAWDASWAWVTTTVSNGIDNLVAWFESIPTTLAHAGAAIYEWVTGLWSSIWARTTSIISSGVDSVINFFDSIPGRIRALGPAVLNAAKWIGHKIAEGLTQIGDFATDLGKKVASTLKSSINWVIDRINEGIASVDDKLPGDLPRIPRLARGAVVDTPTLALIGEAGPEVVVPLSNPQRAQQLAEQSGLLSMLRGAGGGSNVTVIAYLDPTGVIIPITKTVVNDTLNEQGDELAYARAAA